MNIEEAKHIISNLRLNDNLLSDPVFVNYCKGRDEVDQATNLVNNESITSDDVEFNGSSLIVNTKSVPEALSDYFRDAKTFAEFQASTFVPNKTENIKKWYEKYLEALKIVGFIDVLSFYREQKFSLKNLEVSEAIIDWAVAAINASNPIASITSGLRGLKKMENDKNRISLFSHSLNNKEIDRFQVSVGSMNKEHTLEVVLGSFYTKNQDNKCNILFCCTSNLKSSLCVMTNKLELNMAIYKELRDILKAKITKITEEAKSQLL